MNRSQIRMIFSAHASGPINSHSPGRSIPASQALTSICLECSVTRFFAVNYRVFYSNAFFGFGGINPLLNAI